jgi:PAS domain-containing protein
VQAGGEFPVEISLSPLDTPDGLLVTAAIRDVTERKLAEQEQAALLERLQIASTKSKPFGG